jgi:hypothetical protein
MAGRSSSIDPSGIGRKSGIEGIREYMQARLSRRTKRDGADELGA